MAVSNLEGKSILIVRMSAIGDVVQALPVACSIRAAAPTARISWLIQPTPLQLIRHHPAIDEFILFDRRPAWRGFLDLRRRLRARRFDLALVLQTSVKAGLATTLFESPRKIGMDRPRSRELNGLFTTERIPERPRAHVQDEALEFLDYLGVPRRLEWGIHPTDEEAERYGGLLPPKGEEPIVALSVASSLRQKDWPAERFGELADRVAASHGASCVIVGGRSPAEDLAASIVARTARRPPRDLRAWDLRRVAYLLHRADAFVGPDSGPLHIAVALGTPSVALMGYTNPKRVGPTRFQDLMIDAFGDPGEKYTAEAGFRSGRMSRIAADQVAEKIGQALRYAPRTSVERRNSSTE